MYLHGLFRSILYILVSGISQDQWAEQLSSGCYIIPLWHIESLSGHSALFEWTLYIYHLQDI